MTTPPAGPPKPPAYLAPGDRQRHLPTGADIHESLVYSSPNGFRGIEMDVYVPTARTEPAPVVVWIHGGAWLFGTRHYPPLEWPAGRLFQILIDAGFAVASIDYRHSREASFPAQIHDGKAAIRYLRRFGAELGLDPTRLALFGESAGGHLASLLALITDPDFEGSDGVTGESSAVSAIVDFYGVTDVATMPDPRDNFPPEWLAELTAAGAGLPPAPLDVLLGASPYPRPEADRLASSITHVSPAAPPFLIIHGEADRLVPIAQSEKLHAALIGAGATSELVRVAGADHVFMGTDPEPQFVRAVEFLRTHLTSFASRGPFSAPTP